MSHAQRWVLASFLGLLATATWAQDATPNAAGKLGNNSEATPGVRSEAVDANEDASRTGAARSALSAASFVMRASESGLAEVELGKLAARKAASDEVKQFAQAMVREHEQSNAELNSLATTKKLTVAAEPDAEQRAIAQQLNTLSGRAFDAAYMDHMMREHAKAVALFQQAMQLEDQELAAFASKSLPTLQNHRQMAGTLIDRHGEAAPAQGAAHAGASGSH